MGMFDYVRCERELPDGFTGELQTKDFVCEMTTVLIRADGRLLIEDFDWEPVPWNERVYPLAKGVMHLAGSIQRVNRHWRDLDFHGVMNFYGSDRQNVWHEYNAKFTDGNLVEIATLSTPTAEPAL